jgi:hypothetical protein
MVATPNLYITVALPSKLSKKLKSLVSSNTVEYSLSIKIPLNPSGSHPVKDLTTFKNPKQERHD